jgi:hypothetical protein
MNQGQALGAGTSTSKQAQASRQAGTSKQAQASNQASTQRALAAEHRLSTTIYAHMRRHAASDAASVQVPAHGECTQNMTTAATYAQCQLSCQSTWLWLSNMLLLQRLLGFRHKK